MKIWGVQNSFVQGLYCNFYYFHNIKNILVISLQICTIESCFFVCAIRNTWDKRLEIISSPFLSRNPFNRWQVYLSSLENSYPDDSILYSVGMGRLRIAVWMQPFLCSRLGTIWFGARFRVPEICTPGIRLIGSSSFQGRNLRSFKTVTILKNKNINLLIYKKCKVAVFNSVGNYEQGTSSAR